MIISSEESVITHFVNFEIKIKAVSSTSFGRKYKRYTIDVRSHDGREATETVKIDNEVFDKYLREVEDALITYRKPERRRSPVNYKGPSDNVKVELFGKKLFDNFICKKVYACYIVALDNARRNGFGLRLLLKIEPPELNGMPWEFLFDSNKDEYISILPEISIVRSLPYSLDPVEPLKISGWPLRILGMVAQPSDSPKLDTKYEKEQVEEALKDLIESGKVELFWLEQSTRSKLREKLRTNKDQWHIFHFIGHGCDDGRLAFVDGNNHADWIAAKELAVMLAHHRSLRLVILNACYSGRGNQLVPLSNIAKDLLQKRLPAAVVMQYMISDPSAIELARCFYRDLAEGRPVDTSLENARHSLFTMGSIEWGVPALYMRATDGILFDFQDIAPSPSLKASRVDVNRVQSIDLRTEPAIVSRPSQSVTLNLIAQPNPAPLAAEVNWTITICNQTKASIQGLQLSWGLKVLEDKLTLVGNEERSFSQIESYNSVGSHIERVRAIGKGFDEETEAQVSVYIPSSLKADLTPDPTHAIPNETVTWNVNLVNDGGMPLENIIVKQSGTMLAKPFVLSSDQRQQIRFSKSYASVGKHTEIIQIHSVSGGERLFWTIEGNIEVIQSQHKWGEMEFVHVPSGKFLIGSLQNNDIASDDEWPQHSLNIPYDFWIGHYPITNAQFAGFVQSTFYQTAAEKKRSSFVFIDGLWKETEGANWRHPHGPSSNLAQKDNHPVVMVSWQDAREYCRWLNWKYSNELPDGWLFRLPAEAEWEKAARGDKGYEWPWGNETPTDQLCNFNRNIGDTSQVGSYSPLGDSPSGAADMAGNIWEWTNTIYRSYPYDFYDGRESGDISDQRVLRGGSYVNYYKNARCAFRSWAGPDTCIGYYGFRVAVSPIRGGKPITNPRWPLYLLVDCGDSMRGAPIMAVEQGIQLLYSELMGQPQTAEMVNFSLITYSTTAKQRIPLVPITEFTPPGLSAGGDHNLGSALHVLSDCILRDLVKKTTTYQGDAKALVVWITDSDPTDDWLSGLRYLQSNTAGLLSSMVALVCGDAVNLSLLKQITPYALSMIDVTPDVLRQLVRWESQISSPLEDFIHVKLPWPPPGIHTISDEFDPYRQEDKQFLITL